MNEKYNFRLFITRHYQKELLSTFQRLFTASTVAQNLS